MFEHGNDFKASKQLLFKRKTTKRIRKFTRILKEKLGFCKTQLSMFERDGNALKFGGLRYMPSRTGLD